jgi:hypothetical protein
MNYITFAIILLFNSVVNAEGVWVYDQTYENIPKLSFTFRGWENQSSIEEVNKACDTWLQANVTLIKSAKQIVFESKCTPARLTDHNVIESIGIIHFK